MKIKRHKLLDWEPLPLTVTLQTPPAVPIDAFEKFTTEWIDARPGKIPHCHCDRHYLDCRAGRKGATFKVSIEWMCEYCVAAYADAIDRQFGNAIKQLTIGHPPAPRFIPDRHFIEVPAKEVLFEDGSRVQTAPFSIRNYAISIGEFDQFRQVTGYVPIAIARGYEEHYRQNVCVEYPGSFAVEDLDASRLCYLDAQAYCNWSGHRLPTEAEWLAASIVVDGLCSPFETQKFLDAAKRCDTLMSQGRALTNDRQNGLLVAREQTFLFKKEGWETRPNRHLLREDDCLCILYICKK